MAQIETYIAPAGNLDGDQEFGWLAVPRGPGAAILFDGAQGVIRIGLTAEEARRLGDRLRQIIARHDLVARRNHE